MKIRALLTAVAMIAAVLGVAGPAQAATYTSTYSELSFPTYTDNSFQVVLSGRITPATAGRQVSLHSGSTSGNTAYTTATTTDGNGRFSFVVTVTSPTWFKFFAAKHYVGNNTYNNVATGTYLVSPAPPVVYPSSYSELSFPSRADNSSRAVLSGRIWPAAAGRQVSLHAGSTPDNTSYSTATTTDGNGRFSFAVNVASSTYFKFFSAKQPVGNNTYYDNASTGSYLVSPPVPVSYPSSFDNLGTPEYTRQADQKVTLTGHVNQFGSNQRSVSLKKADGTWVAGATTDAYGNFVFPDVPVSVKTSFVFFSPKQQVGATTYEAGTSSSFVVKSLRFWDDFAYTDWSWLGAEGQAGTRWNLRQAAFLPGRSQMRSDRRALSLHDDGGRSVLTMQLKADPDPGNAGKFLTGHISSPYDITTGNFEAKVKFDHPVGAESSFWLQTAYPSEFGGEHEFDVVESFGKGRSSVKHTVVRNKVDRASSLTYPALETSATGSWWDDYHVIKGTWLSTGYWVTVDGGSPRKFDTSGFSGDKTGIMILSLLVNDRKPDQAEEDSQIAKLRAHIANGGAPEDYSFSIDWVRVWR